MTFGKTLNLGNSIIGVSILAMPFCFAQSGVLLSILLIVISGLLTRLSCHFLLKSAFVSKRRSFELMVNDVLGPTGRFLVEIGLIGFLLGTCVAYFIMIGDLAPKILTELFSIDYNHQLRIVTVLVLSLFVALPLSLLRKVDSLTSFSLLSMILYALLVLKLMFETTDKIDITQVAPDKLEKIRLWNVSGLLTTFPIFSMAMSCQTSLFEIFDSSQITFDAIKRDNSIIKRAVYICSFVYITVGLLGYTAFHGKTLYGNILLAFPASLTTTMTKIGFIVTLLMSFPLCLFPCRTSVYSLTVGKMKKTANFQSLPTSASTSTLVGVEGCDDGSNFQKNIQFNHDRNNNGNGVHGALNNNLFPTSREPASNHVKLNHINSSNQKAQPFPSLLDDGDSNSSHVKFQSSDCAINASTIHAPSRIYISDFHFRLLTVTLIAITVILSLMFPHIEFILGFIGSTAGTTVCFVLPAFTFIKLGEHSKLELFLARVLLLIGLAMLIFCTYSTIHNSEMKTQND